MADMHPDRLANIWQEASPVKKVPFPTLSFHQEMGVLSSPAFSSAMQQEMFF